MKLFPFKPNQRNHLVLIAVHNFPSGLFKTSLGVTLLATPFILTYLSERGMTSLTERTIINGLIVLLIPASLLFLVTLIRAPSIRRRKEAEVESERRATVVSLHAIEAQEQKEEKEIVRLQEVVTTDMKARRVKDKQEDERWGQLNERLRLQEETGQLNNDRKEEREVARLELASEERILVAQQVKEKKEEGEVMRKGLASDALEARNIKDLKEDKRWALLNESLRLQKETVEQASEERLLVAQQVKEKKEEGEVMRKGLVSDDLEARHLREQREEKRWEALYERLRIQDERNAERERQQQLRDEEHLRLLQLLTPSNR